MCAARLQLACPSVRRRCARARALQFPANALVHRPELLSYITSERIRSNAQLDGALEHLGKVRRLHAALCTAAACCALRLLTVHARAHVVQPTIAPALPRPLALPAPQLGGEPLDAAKFQEAAGVGVEVGPDQIAAAVAACVAENEAKLQEER